MTPGLFITGTDTEVGKTYVAALIAKSLVAAGVNVGVYKPVASGCEYREGTLIAQDALVIWEAAGRPGGLDEVCPQLFAAPLAPHLAARAEGKEIDAARLRSGIECWRERSEFIIVEGAGGLMSPLGDDEYVADLAADFGYPLIVVSPNRLGTINATLQTLVTAAAYKEGLPVAGVVLNDATESSDDASTSSNFSELQARCVAPLLTHVKWQASGFEEAVDWVKLAHSN